MSASFKKAGDSGFANYRDWAYNNELDPVPYSTYIRAKDFNTLANATFDYNNMASTSSRRRFVFKRAPPSMPVGKSRAPKRYTYHNTPTGAAVMSAVARRGEPPATRGMHHPEVRPRGKGIMYSSSSAIAPGGSPMSLNTTADIRCVNVLGVGTGDYQRSGTRIEMKSARLTGQLVTAAGSGAPCSIDYCRVMLVYDRSPTGVLPALTDILQDQDTSGTASTDALSGMNLTNRDRFAMLIDRRFETPQCTVTSSVISGVIYPTAPCPDNQVFTFDEFRILKSLEARYLNTASSPPSIADLTTGALYLISVSLVTAAGAEPFALNWNLRLRYTDE